MENPILTVEQIRNISCNGGAGTFTDHFGDSPTSLKDMFNTLPKNDVIWLAVHAIEQGYGPRQILELIPVKYSITHKGPAIKWLNHNYKQFIQDCNKLWDDVA